MTEQVNFYTAFMQAADHIEQHPGSFDFYKTSIPTDDCGTVGCALGWVGFYARTMDVPELVELNREFWKCEVTGLPLLPEEDLRNNFSIVTVVHHMASSEAAFYEEMRAAVGDAWRHDALKCAQGLRLYAKKNFKPPVQKPEKQALDPVLAKMLKGLEEFFPEDLTT